MSEWKEIKLINLANKGINSFIDGDWIEAPHLKDDGIRLIQTGNIGRGYFRDDNKKYISEESFQKLNCKEVKSGDILICRLAEPIGRSCKVPNLKTKNITSVDVTIFRVDENNFNKDYILYVINTDEFLNKANEVAGGSTRQRISRSNLANLKIYLSTSLPTQRKIARILSTSDAVIEKTQAAIAKYKAIKQGMLHDLFTRGIDPASGKLRPKYKDAPHLYKQSRLGWIPKEWEVARLGALCSEKLTYGINAAAVDFNHQLPTYIRITDINEDGSFAKNGRKCVNHPLMNQYLLKTGDLVFARTGATVGKTYLYSDSDGVLVFAGFLIKASTDKGLLDVNFLKFFTETSFYNNWVELMSQRSGQPGINGKEYGSLSLPKPDLSEQELISKKLLSMHKKLQTEQTYLLKLQQIKAGLMADLLSGKKKVNVIE